MGEFMNIDFSNFKPLQNARLEYYNRLALNILNGQKSDKKEKVLKDEFIKSNETTIAQTHLIDITSQYIPEALLQDMNDGIGCVVEYDGIVEYKGYRFHVSQIPSVNASKLETVKAADNVLDFGKNNYFKYVTSDGTEHSLFSGTNSIGTLMSESVKQVPISKETEKYASFWRYMMSEDPVYLGISFSDEEIKNYLSEAGLEPGFITIKMGNQVATQYYSQGKIQGIIQSKERYDVDYNGLTSPSGYLKNFASGSVVKVGGVEYIIDESCSIDIPYGVDVFDIEYPKVF